MYANSNGVPPNTIAAYMWYSNSAAGDFNLGAKARGGVGKITTPTHVAEAQKLAREWSAKHKKK